MKPDVIVAQFLSTPWAMDRLHFDNGLKRVESIDLSARQIATLRDKLSPHMRSEALAGRQDTNEYTVINGVAIIPVVGTILKDIPLCYELFEGAAVSTEILREQIESAVQDHRVDSILMEIDSPGGTASGVQELGDAIYRARSQKAIHAAIRDLGASAAYWLASQASFISANATAAIGSIGCVIAVNDVSERAAQEGIRTIVVASGEYKGAGIPGAPITDEEIIPWQEEVDGIEREFVAAIARGRGRSEDEVGLWASGRTWQAREARQLGLIDAVENFDDALRRLSHKI